MLHKIKSFLKNKTFIGKIYRLSEHYSSINNKVISLEKEIESIMASYKALEYRVYLFNSCNNIMLYGLEMQSKKKKDNFNPLVTIVIPVYNGSNYLKEAIECALNQTYKNIEVIVVNDGSKDNGKTKKIAKSYGKKIRYIEKENGGVSSALNMGIKNMKGEYFSWLSHDDLISIDHIERLVNYLSYEGTDMDIPYSNFRIVDKDGVDIFNDTVGANLNCFDYKISMIKNEYTLLQGEINGGSVLIPKKAFEEFGLFSLEQRITQERDMWSRLISKYHFINIPYDTAMIRSHDMQVTNVNPNIKLESDAKNLSIIRDLDKSIKKRLNGNEKSFYRSMQRFFKDNSNFYMYEKMVEEEKKLNK